MIIRVIDFETTDLPPAASVCEAAYVDINGHENVKIFEIDNYWSSLVYPSTEMQFGALATHHITKEELDIGPTISWETAKTKLTENNPIYAAHNADFEKAFFNPENSQWIDTWKVALRLWPLSPAHSNQVLRYFLSINIGDKAMPPHRALPDTWVTAHILLIALANTSLDDLIAWSNEPPFLTKLTFGKHRGKKFSDVPRDYLSWLIKQDMDPGVLAAAHRELDK